MTLTNPPVRGQEIPALTLEYLEELKLFAEADAKQIEEELEELEERRPDG